MVFRSILVMTLLVSAAGCKRERTSVAVDASLLTMVPADTVAMGAMRVKPLVKTAAWKKLLEQPGVNAQLDKLAEETSFDPRKTLWEVLWSTDGKETLVYARGEFAPMGLEPKIEREGVQRMSYKGSMLLGNEEYAVWFLNSSTGIFGHTAKLKQLIDGRDTAKAGPSQALRDRIDAIPPEAHFWAVADAAALPKLPQAQPPKEGGNAMAMNFVQNLPKLMEKVRMVTMHASLVDGVAMEFDAICADETGAKQVHDSLRGLVGLARIAMPAPQRDAWLPVLDGVEVTQNQATAVLKARLTVDQVERAQASLPARKAAEKKAE
jgi:hypothetical protein